jgi:UDP:flavonoid glycosyltransferase YjiC (YdhE family)
VQAACVGVPSVITPAVADQRSQADALVAAGCAIATEPAHLAAECLRLLDDTGLCDAMARRGRDLVDGRGAARVASAVRRLVHARAA